MPTKFTDLAAEALIHTLLLTITTSVLLPNLATLITGDSTTTTLLITTAALALTLITAQKSYKAVRAVLKPNHH